MFEMGGAKAWWKLAASKSSAQPQEWRSMHPPIRCRDSEPWRQHHSVHQICDQGASEINENGFRRMGRKQGASHVYLKGAKIFLHVYVLLVFNPLTPVLCHSIRAFQNLNYQDAVLLHDRCCGGPCFKSSGSVGSASDMRCKYHSPMGPVHQETLCNAISSNCKASQSNANHRSYACSSRVPLRAWAPQDVPRRTLPASATLAHFYKAWLTAC